MKWYVTLALAAKHLVEPARIFEVDTEALRKLGTRERAFLDEVVAVAGPAGGTRSASTSAAGTRREVEGAPAYGLPTRAPHYPVCCRSRGARGHHAQPGAADSFGTSVRGCLAQGGGDAADMRITAGVVGTRALQRVSWALAARSRRETASCKRSREGHLSTPHLARFLAHSPPAPRMAEDSEPARPRRRISP